ncbi:MAG: substrate-binding domain-containing protein [Methylacidiphilales bacterium]|nr:substrate-binding domain-containing protein [Candidatus Methylacidiphilales bacterium]
MKKTRVIKTVILITLVLGTRSSFAEIHVVGSGTVYPFTVKVAEVFASKSSAKIPRVEGIGTGAGIKLYCSPSTSVRPQLLNASRLIKDEEREQCEKNGRSNLVEMNIGYDGVVLIRGLKNSNAQLTLYQLYRAIARYVPNSDETNFIENSTKFWSEIDSSLPKTKIEIYGPYAASGTRDTIDTLIVENICKKIKSSKQLSKADFEKYCRSIRIDGGYIETGDNFSLTVSKVSRSQNAFGLVGFSYLIENKNKVGSVAIESVIPTIKSISNGTYPYSRKLYLYATEAEMKSNQELNEFLKEYFSERAIGENGYVTKIGLIASPLENRKQLRTYLNKK